MNYKDIFFRKIILILFFIFSFLPVLSFLYFNFPVEGISNEVFRALYISVIGSVVGHCLIIWLWWQVVLGFRGFIARHIVDLIWLINFHKYLGISGIIFVFIHPLLSTYGYGLNYIFNLDLSSEFDKHVFMGVISSILFIFIWLVSGLLRRFLSFRVWKYLHFLTYLIVALGFFHAFGIGSLINGSTYLKLYFLFFLISFILMFVLRLLNLAGLFLGKFKYNVSHIQKINQNVTLYRFTPVTKKHIKPLNGQFIHIQKSSFGEEHPFTVASFDEKDNSITLLIKSAGKFTKELSNVSVGSKVNIDGAYGVFTKEVVTTDKKNVLIAGGIGITPFLDLCKYNAEKIEILFWGNRTVNDIFMIDEIQKHIKVINFLSADKKDNVTKYLNNDKLIEFGYINISDLKKYLGKDLSGYNFFICGPKIMMDKISSDLYKNGIPKKQVFMEKFGWQ